MLINLLSNNAFAHEGHSPCEYTKQKTPKTTFTLNSLKKFNGQNASKAYVAIDGIVYDVTNNESWVKGVHLGVYSAGADLSEEIKKSPHKNEVLCHLPKVGVLIK